MSTIKRNELIKDIFIHGTKPIKEVVNFDSCKYLCSTPLSTIVRKNYHCGAILFYRGSALAIRLDTYRLTDESDYKPIRRHNLLSRIFLIAASDVYYNKAESKIVLAMSSELLDNYYYEFVDYSILNEKIASLYQSSIKDCCNWYDRACFTIDLSAQDYLWYRRSGTFDIFLDELYYALEDWDSTSFVCEYIKFRKGKEFRFDENYFISMHKSKGYHESIEYYYRESIEFLKRIFCYPSLIKSICVDDSFREFVIRVAGSQKCL